MAEENTTASTPTPTEPPVADPSPAAGSENTSTTPPTETPEPEAESTLLTGAATEDKPVEKTAEEIAAEAEHAKLFGAPEGEYEISGLPDDMEIDKDALAAVTPLAKELGLSNEGFSKLANVYGTQIMPKVVDGVVDGLQKDIAATHAQWATDAIELVKNDPVFEGKKLADVQQMAAKSLDRFGSPEFRQFLNDSGLGNHPAMMKFAYMTGAMIAEDTTFERGGTALTKKSVTDKFYGPQG